MSDDELREYAWFQTVAPSMRGDIPVIETLGRQAERLMHDAAEQDGYRLVTSARLAHEHEMVWAPLGEDGVGGFVERGHPLAPPDAEVQGILLRWLATARRAA